METNRVFEIYNILKEMFPNARCELNYSNNFELVIATLLSAQTTDKKVNSVTSILFEKYKDPLALSNASFDDVYEIIKPLGLANNKTKNIINLSKVLCEKYNQTVPSNFDELVKLPGVGRKTSNVVLSEGFNKCAFACDTHVMRVANRLDLIHSNNELEVENYFTSNLDESLYHDAHLKFLFFGRYLCKAIKPDCNKCFYKNCSYLQNNTKNKTSL